MTSQTYIIDQPTLTNKNQTLLPFATTDVLIEVAGQNAHHFLHFWQLQQTMILGMKDTRVADLTAGLRALKKASYSPIVRNSGGLGVISDEGVLNVSLILPIEEQGQKRTIDEGYEAMLSLVRKAFSSTEIEAYEIPDSYCPGTYDLSIDGKKFAGIAQRRVKNGLAIMMYLSITGDQAARGRAVQQFYQASLGQKFGLDGYPPVKPDSMENLPTLLKEEMTIEQVKHQIATAYEALYGSAKFYESTDYIEEKLLQPAIDQHLLKMKQRNEMLKELSV
ncbi:lipoate--protein ligase [Enterococcus sp. JM4C]|uniref:lipoate--protein ligase family protein n=1 Tax=Candidatus Enterococcus huntleyi TaxID=1857217 RepID=UPI00137945B7|nr:lipoate--protein ligase family protein [Enterococcus sp. JM4C]KAF1295730.1 lipoate--protein ligase [Enterococcus sp. JM4C]